MVLYWSSRLCSIVRPSYIFVAVSFLIVSSFGEPALPSSVTSSTTTCSSDFFNCGNKCIPDSWLCDGDSDCDDGSDESLPQCSTKICTKDEFKCGSPSRCIPLNWACDSEDDCADGSDEHAANCSISRCVDNQFQCPISKLCIPKTWLCDGNKDCGDGADESNCTLEACKSNEFLCNNGRCIFKRWMCDHDDDCGDRSDELLSHCNYTCSPGHFQCESLERRCIPEQWRCDGEADCEDRSDEMNCKMSSTKRCHQFEFQCDNGVCIHGKWRCDGDFDCTDKSDEKNCSISCSVTQFKCKDPESCVPSSTRCNGIFDCADGSDENDQECASVMEYKKKCNPVTEYDCGNKFCIPISKLCDGTPNCPGHQPRDESPYVNCTLLNIDHCLLTKCGSEQICHSTYLGAYCECKHGFQVDRANQTKCIDIDECQIEGWCSQWCENTVGSFHCICRHGYILAEDRRTCLAMGERPSLWLSNKAHIKEIDIRTTQRKHLLEDLQSAVAMDFHYKKNIVAWSDVQKEQILICHLKNDSGNHAEECQHAIVPGNVSTSDGLAIDWIHELLYWTDTGFNTISVVSLDGKYRKTLISENLDEPRAIALDPRKGVMFWTDWGGKAKIESAGMDGTHRRTVIDDVNFVAWPNGLAVDLVLERLYFADAKHKHIISTDYDGQRPKVVLNSWATLRHPFSLTVFENRVYWTDWETEGVHYANKFDGSNATLLVTGLYGPMTVRVHHEMTQPTFEIANKCANHPCSHLCTPTLHMFKGQAPYQPFTCLCADGYDIHRDGFSCVGVGYSETLRSPVPIEPPKTGQFVSVTVGILAIIALLGAALTYLLWKRLDSKVNKRINFENPIYRRSSDPNGNDHYDHLRLSIDSSEVVHDFGYNDSQVSVGGSGVYQPTTVTVGNYAIATSTAYEKGNNSMKLPLTEHLYDEQEFS